MDNMRIYLLYCKHKNGSIEIRNSLPLFQRAKNGITHTHTAASERQIKERECVRERESCARSCTKHCHRFLLCVWEESYGFSVKFMTRNSRLPFHTVTRPTFWCCHTEVFYFFLAYLLMNVEYAENCMHVASTTNAGRKRQQMLIAYLYM